jgi:TM2 domain-containing membrane protein YozV
MSNPPENIKLIVRDSIVKSNFKTKKVIAAILAFPLPFGLLGLHRIFLGTKPYIPFVYIGTLGGCLLVLPLVDFIAILFANEQTFKHFENNPRVFIWSH